MNNNLEKIIIAKYGRLTPSKILRYYIEDAYFKMAYEKYQYTFIVMGESGPTGKTWLAVGLRKHGFNAIELSESIYDLVDYHDHENHVIVNDFERVIIIVLNKPVDEN